MHVTMQLKYVKHIRICVYPRERERERSNGIKGDGLGWMHVDQILVQNNTCIVSIDPTNLLPGKKQKTKKEGKDPENLNEGC